MADRYAAAGVDLEEAARALEGIRPAVTRTHGPEVIQNPGGFAGLFSASALKGMRDPLLVATTDGVGTKALLASQYGQLGGLGIDLVNHCVNDLLTQGATPLFFLDYVASGRLDAATITTLVQGMSEACLQAGCAILGGETAEMPGVYTPGALELVGTLIGVVEREDRIDGSRIQPGDAVIGLRSDSPHTNGYTLIRAVLADLDATLPVPALNGAPLPLLLAPHRSYLHPIRALQHGGIDVRGLAHITGGGLIDNPVRMLPAGRGLRLDRCAWTVPPIYRWLQERGGIDDAELARVFNLGLGMLVVVPAGNVPDALRLLAGLGLLVGEVTAGPAQVTW